jgi:pimeloyl-ACP methyl ester carboxylesterase
MSSVTLTLLLLLTATLPQSSNSSKQKLILQPCDVPNLEGKARCGTMEVFEDRASRKGRKISLKVIVLPATGEARQPDPLFYIPGGPGSSATEDAPGIAILFKRIREHRDLVFLDQRGTGGSHSLDCPLYNENDPQSFLGYFFPLDDVKKCREKLERESDLKLYTTPIAMDDLDEVRAALGYERINLFGGSYGTRASLVYLRQHPDHVRTIILQGVAPTNQFMPHDFPQANERALQGVISECAADEVCRRAFPDLSTELKTVLNKLVRAPVEVEITPATGYQPSTGSVTAPKANVKLSRDLAAEAIRYMLYQPIPASRIPLLVHQAATGNFVPLAETALAYRRNLVATGSNGLYLSITCAEDLPWIKPGLGERLAVGTFLGDYRLRQQREACALWPRANIPADYANPIRGSAPALILTGQWDPVTPPSNGDAAARHLPNSLHVVVPHGGHGLGGLKGIECIEQLMTQFVEQGTAKGLDTSCVQNIHRAGFALN